MNSRERVIRTLEFNSPDRVAKDLWVLPATRMHYKEEFENLYNRYEVDIMAVSGPFDHASNPKYYELGTLVDEWGSEWTNIQAGIIGEVKNPVFADEDKIPGYQVPTARFLKEWAEMEPSIQGKIQEGRKADKFIIGGWISFFERMQYLRGTEDLYCDIAMEDVTLDLIKQYVMEFYDVYLDKWLEQDIDAVSFGDDWGSQISLLISPEAWKIHFKPMYQTLFDRIKAKGKKIFFHSDGYIMDLYPEFIAMGVDAINSQLWCMGVEKVAAQYAGKITFWGEVSRQTILPNGTVEEVENCKHTMVQNLFVNGGGFIGQSEVGRDVPLANIEVILKDWK